MLKELNVNVSEGRRKRNRQKRDFQFLNIDLELMSSDDPEPLIKELGERILILYSGRKSNGEDHFLSVEIRDYDTVRSFDDTTELRGGADVTLSAFCDLLESLSSEARRLWDACKELVFDIGFECGNTAKSFHTQISAKTLNRVSELGASVVITVYPHVNYTLRSELKNENTDS